MADVMITAFPIDLLDGDDFEWNIDDDGSVSDGTNSAFWSFIFGSIGL